MWIFGLIEFISYFISYATYWMEGMCKISSLPRNCVVSFKVINWVFSVGSNPISWIPSSGFFVVKVALLLFLYSISVQSNSNTTNFKLFWTRCGIHVWTHSKIVSIQVCSKESVIFGFDPTLIKYDNKRGATFTSQEVSEMISFDNTHLKNAIRNFKGTL